jgi:predicted molibdopterin-dependent oxidoreductase YjgC
MPSGFVEVKPIKADVPGDFPIALFVGDDPHHYGCLTEKSHSLASFSGEVYAEISADLASRLGVRSGGSVRIESTVGKIIVPVRISDHIDNDVVFLPRNFSAAPVNALQSRKVRNDWVKLTKVSD